MEIRIFPIGKIFTRQTSAGAIRYPSRTLGFTLIELMIVVAILAIIAGFAYPSYTRYVIETRRSDGQAAAVQLATQLEKYFTQCGTYTTTILTGSISACTGLGSPDKSPNQNYQLTIQPAPPGGTIASSYQINAAPLGAQANDTDCQTLWLTSTGATGQTGPNTQNRCWRK